MRSKEERAERAKLFQPYDSLRGFKEYLAAKERVVVAKKHLSQDTCEILDRKLHQLRIGMMVKVVYYEHDSYIEIKGLVSKFDLAYTQTLQIVNTVLKIKDIVEIQLDEDVSMED